MDQMMVQDENQARWTPERASRRESRSQSGEHTVQEVHGESSKKDFRSPLLIQYVELLSCFTGSVMN